MRTLVADDDPASRRLLEIILAGMGLEAVSAGDGREAWEILQRPDAPPIAVLDWLMPHVDGLEVCRRVRAHPVSGCRYIILLTARGDRADIVAGLQAGADDYVVKPIDRDELVARLQAGQRIVSLQAELSGRLQEIERLRHDREAILDAAAEGILRMEGDERISFVNPAGARMMGASAASLIGRSLLDALQPAWADGTPHARETCPLLAVLSDGETHRDESGAFRRADGTLFPVTYASTPIHDGGGVVGAVVTFVDITRRKAAEEALAEQAVRDTLTNLYNRRTFAARMTGEIARAARHGETVALLLCDLDRFKLVNDLWGHGVGDAVIVATARGIQETVRGGDLVFRWGGDEMVVVLGHVTREGVHAAAQRIRDRVRQATTDERVQVELSVGIALYPDHGATPDELVRWADHALYIAKQSGSGIQVGADEYDLSVESIDVALQPICRSGTGEVVGYEALTRDARGSLTPGELFRRYQTVGRLTDFKILCFRRQLEVVRQLELDRVFLNVDFRMLRTMPPVLAPGDAEVTLEISEGEALDDVRGCLAVVDEWRKRGFRFAIDDFGGGFVSLPFMAEAEPDYIKIDREAIVQALSSTRARRCFGDVVRALRSYARAGIVAEGVETPEELAVVRDLEIEFAQGFLLGRPLLARALFR